jgi:protocatechuate 3,4-dioxygenase beta subunit
MAASPLLAATGIPWETAGPYPGDGSNGNRSQDVVNALTQDGIVRKDIRPSFGQSTTQAPGATFDLAIQLIDAQSEKPLANHALYIWHCDAEGNYSLYDIPNENFLRGVGISDENGQIEFKTIFPGCYDGRWPHIHFEVFETIEKAVSGENSLLTAQMAFKEENCQDIYQNAQDIYTNGLRNLQRTTLTSDNVFGDNTEEQIEQQTVQINSLKPLAGTIAIAIDPTMEKTMGGMPPGGPMGPGGPGGPGGARPPFPRN